MRQYPRRLAKGREDRILVHNEIEEYEAGLKGYERHWNPEVNEREKGTDKEVLRVKPVDVQATNIDPLEEPKHPVENGILDDVIPGIEEKLTPGQKAAITRKKNREAKKAGK